MIHHRICLITESTYKEKKVWSNDASSRLPDLISVLSKLHKPKSAGLLNSIRWYVTSSFKVICQTFFEKIDLTIMDLRRNLCRGITPKIINLQPIMIHHRICLIAESTYKEKNVVGRRIKSRAGFDFRFI